MRKKSATAGGWMVVRVRPSLLLRALKNLRQQGCETYVPRAALPQKNGRRVIQPLFVGYVFSRHPEGRWSFLRGTFGVIDFFTWGEGPAYIPDAEIARLRAREDDRGLVDLAPKPGDFKLGDRVHVAGLGDLTEAVFEGMTGAERAVVLMQLMGRWVRTEVELKRVAR